MKSVRNIVLATAGALALVSGAFAQETQKPQAKPEAKSESHGGCHGMQHGKHQRHGKQEKHDHS